MASRKPARAILYYTHIEVISAQPALSDPYWYSFLFNYNNSGP